MPSQLYTSLFPALPDALYWPSLLPLLLFGVGLGVLGAVILSLKGIFRYLSPGWAVSYQFYAFKCLTSIYVHWPALKATLLSETEGKDFLLRWPFFTLLLSQNKGTEELYHMLVSCDTGFTVAVCIGIIYAAMMPLAPVGGHPRSYQDKQRNIDYFMMVPVSNIISMHISHYFPGTIEGVLLVSFTAASATLGWRLMASRGSWNKAQNLWIAFMLGSVAWACVGLQEEYKLCSMSGCYDNYLRRVLWGSHGVFLGLHGVVIRCVPQEAFGKENFGND